MKLLRHLTAVGILVLLSATSALAQQRHMENAIEHLRAARAELNQADRNKGGHRERALADVDAAIRECRDGIVWARNHR